MCGWCHANKTCFPKDPYDKTKPLCKSMCSEPFTKMEDCAKKHIKKYEE